MDWTTTSKWERAARATFLHSEPLSYDLLANSQILEAERLLSKRCKWCNEKLIDHVDLSDCLFIGASKFQFRGHWTDETMYSLEEVSKIVNRYLNWLEVGKLPSDYYG